jgi:hypothetical protein
MQAANKSFRTHHSSTKFPDSMDRVENGLPHENNLVTPTEFIKDAKDFHGSFAVNTEHIATLPDGPWYRRSTYFTQGWSDPWIWRASVSSTFKSVRYLSLCPNTKSTASQLIEGVGSFCITFLSGQFGITVANYDIIRVGPFISIWLGALIAILIYATATKSGGQLNPIITISSMGCGLTPVPRGVLYLLFQTLGGAIGGGFLLASLGHEKARK